MLGLTLDLPKVNTGLFSFRPASERGAPDFGAWLHEVTPSFTWDAAHLRHLQAQLQRVTSGEINRLMIFFPPRHGKSELATVRYP